MKPTRFTQFARNATLAALASLAAMSAALAGGSCDTPDLPRDFQIQKNYNGLNPGFRVEDSAHLFGTLRPAIGSFTRQIWIKNPDNTAAYGYGKRRLFSWGSVVDVYDCNDVKIGEIRENVMRSLFKAYTEYSVKDASGAEIAKSYKKEIFSTSFEIYDSRGQLAATLSRPWYRGAWGQDNWKVSVAQPGAIDGRVLVLIAAYKSIADHDRASSSSSD